MTLKQAERIAELRAKWVTLNAMRQAYYEVFTEDHRPPEIAVLDKAITEILAELSIIFDYERKALENV